MKINQPTKEFFGSATVGEKGQIVIPAEARQALGLAKGEKLMVFGVGEEILMLAKFSQLEKFAASLSAKLEQVQKIIGNKKK
jgi:AbrB family looped-hinge helix DNA binding protein